MVKTKEYGPEETVICPCCGATVPYEVITLDSNQVKDIENKLDAYDKAHIKYTIDGEISLGIVKDLPLPTLSKMISRISLLKLKSTLFSILISPILD
mgnify:CR=1 FL=1